MVRGLDDLGADGLIQLRRRSAVKARQHRMHIGQHELRRLCLLAGVVFQHGAQRKLGPDESDEGARRLRQNEVAQPRRDQLHVHTALVFDAVNALLIEIGNRHTGSAPATLNLCRALRITALSILSDAGAGGYFGQNRGQAAPSGLGSAANGGIWSLWAPRASPSSNPTGARRRSASTARPSWRSATYTAATASS